MKMQKWNHLQHLNYLKKYWEAQKERRAALNIPAEHTRHKSGKRGMACGGMREGVAF